ncbi:MAG: proton-conducting transporter membrane subunit [Coriobacteriia bacterium]|nr:proton-conducting transporter membrane subunit [Coriobacteriia bacterium]
MNPSAILPAAVFLPILAAALVVPLSKISERARGAGLVLVTTLVTGLVALLIPGALEGETYGLRMFQMTPTIWLQLRVDPLGLLFAITACVLWLLAVIYSVGYMADGHRKNRYFAFLMLALTWTLGVAFAGNLLSFLVFYELFSILTYPLVVHEQTPEAMAAGTKYITYIIIGSGFVLLAIMGTYFLAGSLDFSDSAFFAASELSRTALLAVFWCFIAGFGVKAALMPLHGWVPDAHPAAPAPFSAVLSGIMVAAGSFGILRVLHNVFGVPLLGELGVGVPLGVLAATTVMVAAVLAVAQDNLKRRLAFSTISQMGYVIFGASLLNINATTGALVHIANHAFMKATLFFCAGIVIRRAGVHKVSEMAGIAKRHPITMGVFTLTALSMIGTPPLSGFTSKWYLGLGILDAEKPWYLAVLLGGALLAAVYLLPIVYSAYFKEPSPIVRNLPETTTRLEAPWTMLGPLLAGAALTVVLGILAWTPGLPLSLARLAAETLP